MQGIFSVVHEFQYFFLFHVTRTDTGTMSVIISELSYLSNSEEDYFCSG